MKNYKDVTVIEYFTKKQAIMDSDKSNMDTCHDLHCKVCPFNKFRMEMRECSCRNMETAHLQEAIKFVMDYEIPVDWSKVAVDTPILVRDCSEDEWKRRYFAKCENGKVYAFNAGCTSWSADDSDDVTYWEYAKLAEKVEGEKL